MCVCRTEREREKEHDASPIATKCTPLQSTSVT